MWKLPFIMPIPPLLTPESVYTTTNLTDTTSNDSVSTFMKTLLLLVDVMQPQFCAFLSDWTVFKWIANLPTTCPVLQCLWWHGPKHPCQHCLTSFILTKEDFLYALEEIWPKKLIMLYTDWHLVLCFIHSVGELINDLVVQLKFCFSYLSSSSSIQMSRVSSNLPH